MPYDDFFRIEFVILSYLYKVMREGRTVDWSVISPEALEIPEKYFRQIFLELMRQGFIKGLRYEEIGDDIRIADRKKVMITAEGIEYLNENSMMRKVADFFRGIKEVVPFIQELSLKELSESLLIEWL